MAHGGRVDRSDYLGAGDPGDFGYSFATWRFHLRGETIRSAADVGWMRDLTVRQMMQRGVPTASVDLLVSMFCQAFPLGSAKQVTTIDEEGRYAGLVLVSEAHETEDQTTSDRAIAATRRRHAIAGDEHQAGSKGLRSNRSRGACGRKFTR